MWMKRWFGHVKIMENGWIAKKIYVGEWAGSRSVGSLRKMCIDTVKDFLKKRGLDVRQPRRMFQDRSVWLDIVRGECMGRRSGDEPLTLMRCHSKMKPLKGGSPYVAKPRT